MQETLCKAALTENMTPYRYLTVERITVAKQLPQTTDLKVSEVSVMVGFRDDGNFIRAFKSINGMTPQLYRSNLMKQGWASYRRCKYYVL